MNKTDMNNRMSTEDMIDYAKNKYVDVAYMEMLNGFDEVGTEPLVKIVRAIWLFAIQNPICSIDDYWHFMQSSIGSQFNLLSSIQYTSYGEKLKTEMLYWLTEKLINSKYTDDTKKYVSIEPDFNFTAIQLKKTSNIKYELLYSDELREEKKKKNEVFDNLYVDTWRTTFKRYSLAFKDKYGLTYKDVENWGVGQWTTFENRCRVDKFHPINLRPDTDRKESHRPMFNKSIKMIDAESGEVFERFKNRADVIEVIGIKKSRLSQCIKSAKEYPNCTAKWTAYKYEDVKYYFVED